MIPHQGLHRIAASQASIKEAADILMELRKSHDADQCKQVYHALLAVTRAIVHSDPGPEKTAEWMDLVCQAGVYYKYKGDKDADKFDVLEDMLIASILFAESHTDEALLFGNYTRILKVIAQEDAPAPQKNLQELLGMSETRLAASLHVLLHRDEITREDVNGETAYSLTLKGRYLMMRSALSVSLTETANVAP